MVKTFQYSKKVLAGFTGRNGTGNSLGVAVFNTQNDITLNPITGRLGWAKCDMSLPKEDFQRFIDFLQECCNQMNESSVSQPVYEN